MKLRLKKQYVGVTISRHYMGLGTITFDTNVSEEDYINYYNLGFDMLFDEVKETYAKVKTTVKTTKRTKKDDTNI